LTLQALAGAEEADTEEHAALVDGYVWVSAGGGDLSSAAVEQPGDASDSEASYGSPTHSGSNTRASLTEVHGSVECVQRNTFANMPLLLVQSRFLALLFAMSEPQQEMKRKSLLL
jgi:hypothetical protein